MSFFPSGKELKKISGPWKFAEGPAADDCGGLLFTTMGTIQRYEYVTEETSLFRDSPGWANGITFGPDGTLYMCEDQGRCVSRLTTNGIYEVLASRYNGKRLNSPNDLCLDSRGRIYFTDPRYGDKFDMELDHESVYRLTPPEKSGDEWEILRVTLDTTCPNGILLEPDDRTFWVSNSDYRPGMPRELRKYHLQSNGLLGELDVVHRFYPGRAVDGMVMDIEGNVFATAGRESMGNQPGVYVFSREGELLEFLPTSNMPTNCTFGGDDLSTLFITVVAPKTPESNSEFEGWLFSIPANTRGRLWFPPAGK
jgi:gluconolactonase